MTPTLDRRPRVWLDHFVVGIDDLDRGCAEFATKTGVEPAYGGEHPRLGTHNALVSLGRARYLEVLAPRAGAEVHPLFGAAARHATLTPILLALATDDIDGLHRSLGAAGFSAVAPTPGSRETEQGETLRWSMFALEEGSPSGTPFFIQWDPGTVHPSESSPTGCTLETFTVASPDHEDLRGLFAAVGFDVRVVPGEPGMEIHLRTPSGRTTIPGGE